MKGLNVDALFRFGDAVLLSLVYLFQNIFLNIFIIRHFRETFYAFLLFLLDFMMVLLFSFTLFLAYKKQAKAKRREAGLNVSSCNSVISNRTESRNSSHQSECGHFTDCRDVDCFSKVSKLPFSYVSWIVYSAVLIFKIVLLFKSEIPQTLVDKGTFLGPQLLKFCIGLTAIAFSLLVEAHHDAHDEPLRREYIKSVAYGMALELLDSTSFLGMLISTDSKLVYTFFFENVVIGLSAVNFMLPSIALYKLTVSNFGRSYPVPLGSLYKVLHLLLVDVPYLGIRIYLWQLGSDISLFIIKNMYSIARYLRDFYTESKNLKEFYDQRRRMAKMKNLTSLNCKFSNALHDQVVVAVEADAKVMNVT